MCALHSDRGFNKRISYRIVLIEPDNSDDELVIIITGIINVLVPFSIDAFSVCIRLRGAVRRHVITGSDDVITMATQVLLT